MSDKMFRTGDQSTLYIDMIERNRRRALEHGWCMELWGTDPDNHAHIWYGAGTSWDPLHRNPKDSEVDRERRLMHWFEMGGV